MRDWREQGKHSTCWALLEPHERQAWINHGQTLAGLAARQGLAADEALAIIEDRKWHFIPDHEALAILRKLEEAL